MIASTDVAVVGGGVIGLSIAYVLSQAGVRCAVIDKGPIGREASWAGAGLIPAHCERVNSSPLNALRSWSALLYAEWADRIQEQTSLDIGFRRTGGVDVALTDQEAADLQVAAGRWRKEKVVFEKLPPGDYVRVEPALNPAIRAAYFLPDRGQVRNPWLLRALQTANEQRGVTLLPNNAVTRFEVKGGRVVGVQTEAGAIACGSVVVSAGAWSGNLLATLGLAIPTPPLKGEIILLRSEKRLLTRIVEHGKNYLVPREDGRILIGATEEEVGFDKRSTPLAYVELLNEALQLVPSLAEAEVEKAWAGLRPGSIDTRPYLGALPELSNAYVASGHKRAGLQLAPATAEVVADLVLGREPRIDLSGFKPIRDRIVDDDPAFRS